MRAEEKLELFSHELFDVGMSEKYSNLIVGALCILEAKCYISNLLINKNISNVYKNEYFLKVVEFLDGKEYKPDYKFSCKQCFRLGLIYACFN